MAPTRPRSPRPSRAQVHSKIGRARLKVTSVLHELPPPRTGRSGRPRTRGARLGTPADVATLARRANTWRTTRVRRYGRTDSVQISERFCLWYGSFRSRTVRVILVCDDKPRTRGGDDRGYGLPLVTTDLESSAEDLVARYASRWGIEQAFADARHIIGVGEPRNRTRRAVEPTVPFGFICFSVVTLWYALHGHAPEEVTGHRTGKAGGERRRGGGEASSDWPTARTAASPKDQREDPFLRHRVGAAPMGGPTDTTRSAWGFPLGARPDHAARATPELLILTCGSTTASRCSGRCLVRRRKLLCGADQAGVVAAQDQCPYSATGFVGR